MRLGPKKESRGWATQNLSSGQCLRVSEAM
jgi:hypothetical protein